MTSIKKLTNRCLDPAEKREHRFQKIKIEARRPPNIYEFLANSGYSFQYNRSDGSNWGKQSKQPPKATSTSTKPAQKFLLKKQTREAIASNIESTNSAI